MKPNPIQQVLRAERDAHQHLEQVRLAAEDAIAQARQRAKEILARNDDRIKRALAAYERRWTAQLEQESQRLRRESTQLLDASKAAVEDRFDQIVAETFAEFWPE